MKKRILFICSLFIVSYSISSAQDIETLRMWKKFSSGPGLLYDYKTGKFRLDTNWLATPDHPGLLKKLNGNSSQFMNGSGNWATPAGGGGSTDTTSLSNRIDAKLAKTDTASLSSRINAKLASADTASLSNRINAKMSPSDTASLSNRINAKLASADTASLSSRINTKLASTDTASLSSRINTKLASADTASLSSRINTKLASTDTASLSSRIDLKAPLASPAFTGTPTAPTAAFNTNTTQVATTAYAYAADPKYARVTGSNVTTTGQTLVDIAGLSFAAAANTVYEIEANLTVSTSAVTTGTKYGINYSAAGATVEATIQGSKTTTTDASDRINALNTASGNAYLTTSAQSGAILIKGILTTGANAGNITIQHLKVTSGTSTVFINSYLKVTKIQ